MVFSLSRAGAARCLLDAGNIPIGGDLGAAYAGQFHESDPNRDALFEGEGSAPIMVRSKSLGLPQDLTDAALGATSSVRDRTYLRVLANDHG